MWRFPGDPGRNEANVTSFMLDNLISSNLVSSARNQFIEDTIRLLRGETVEVAAPPPAAPSAVKPAPFKKGIKIAGPALRQVVGNVRPTHTQQYSDDESSERRQPALARGISSTPTVQYEEEVYFPSIGSAKKVTKSARKQKARELAPDEDWGEPVIEPTIKKEEILPKPVEEFQLIDNLTSTERVHAKPDDIVEDPHRFVSEPSSSTTSLLADIPCHIPDNILSFDFKFEDEEEEDVVSANAENVPSFDLFRQMFTQPVVTLSTPTTVEPTTETSPLQSDISSKTYSPEFLLRVLTDLRNHNSIPVPKELANLSYRQTAGGAEPPRATESWRQEPESWQQVPRRPETSTQGFW